MVNKTTAAKTSAAKTAAPKTVPAETFAFDEEESAPKIKRTVVREPNPYLGVVAALVPNGPAKVSRITGKIGAVGTESANLEGIEDEPTVTKLRKVRRLLTEAGAEQSTPITVRWRLTQVDENTVKVAIYTNGAKIVKKKGKDAAPTA